MDIYLDEKDIPGQPEQVRLTFQVKDTGVGMSQEFQKVLFDSFTRGKDSRIDTIQGSGLGMAITKQLVDLLGGTIQVDSQEGEGSAFTVILDLDRAPAPENEGRLDGERILLVGERDLLSAVMQSITRLGGLDRLRPRWGARRRDPPGPGRCGDALLLGHPGPAHGGPGLSRGGAGHPPGHGPRGTAHGALCL